MHRYITQFSTKEIPSVQTDTVIVGSGLAGLQVANHLISLGEEPIIITKKPVGVSNSFLAQGGIAAAVGREDTPELHFKDTLLAGKGICDVKNVFCMVETGACEVINLIKEGVPFDKDETGNIKLTKEGAHSKNRVLHIKDKTGYHLTKFLAEKIKNKAHLLEGYFIEEILTDENRFIGVLVSNQKQKKIIYAKSLVIASGGYSPIYYRNTSAYNIGGDVIGNAFRAGVFLQDMEFVQFHPTALYIEGEPAYLLTEALRGEGAVLIDEKGNRFIDELKPRDEVARAIYSKYLNNEKVFLDLTPIQKKGVKLSERYPAVFEILKKYSLENQINKIPVSPAAHFSMGGIKATAFGETNVKGIFAVGEASCTAVHGANRLASNSLLECIAFGKNVAYGVYKYNLYAKIKQKDIKNKLQKNKHLTSQDRKLLTQKIKKVMWENVGLSRNEKRLNQALSQINQLLEDLKPYQNSRYIVDLLTVAKAVVKSALNRKESRGAHYREDFPKESEEFRKHSIIKDKSMKIHLEVN